MKRPDEAPSLTLHLELMRNEQLMEAVYSRRMPVPPCTIDDEEIEIFSFDPNG